MEAIFPLGRSHRDQKYFRNCKDRFLEMYGRSCACCGESTVHFLTIEHKQGQAGKSGRLKKTGAPAYREACREYRPDLYETLCYNCNLGRRFLGYCPHQIKACSDD